jgi:hypothetical protein
MNRSVLRQILIACSLAIPVLSLGCNRHAANGNSTGMEQSGPEERFNRIMESFRRKIDGQPVGFVIVQGSSRTTMSGSNKVTSELIKPTTADGHYKAIVTVATTSHYSLRRSKAAEDAAEREKNAKNQQATNALDDPKEKKGIGILDPDLAGPPKNDTNQSATSTIPPDEDIVTRRTPPEDTRKYELVDDGQRWVLITKLDPKTEQSIRFAFDEALAMQ